MNLKLENIIRIIYHGWREAGKISSSQNVEKSRFSLYLDMIYCYCKYLIRMPQYTENEIYNLQDNEKERVCKELKKQNYQKEYWEKVYNKNWIFLEEYSKLKWERTSRTRARRANAYIKHFGLGKNCYVQYGAMFICEHFNVGKLKVGENCLFARGCDIDYTGDLTIGNNVGILEGAKILTHAHDAYHFMKESDLIPFSNRAYKTNLTIGDNVSICVHAVILPGVREIGEGSIIQAGAVVDRPVPPHVIVAGNPAKVVRKIPTVVNRTKH